MKPIPVLALSNTKCGVGRLIGLTKQKIDWHLVLNNELLFLTVYVSSISKTVRIALFDKLIAEDNYTSGMFKIRVMIGKDELYFLKKDSSYDLAVNRTSFKKLPTSGDPNLDLRLVETLPRLNNFSASREGDGWSLTRLGPSIPPNVKAPSARPGNLGGTNGSIGVSNASLNLLNDSMEAYDHRFYFLPTDESNEDPHLIRFVNIPI